jgi:hypothetical protein
MWKTDGINQTDIQSHLGYRSIFLNRTLLKGVFSIAKTFSKNANQYG